MEKCEFTPGEDLTSTGTLAAPGGTDPWVHRASVNQGCFKKRMGPILPLGRLEAGIVLQSGFRWGGGSLPPGSVPQPAGL